MGLFSWQKKDDKAQQEVAASPANDVPATAKARSKAPENDRLTLTPIMSDELRNAISRLKGQKPGPDLTTPEMLARMFPVSAQIAREEAAQEAARKKAEAEALNNPQPGQLVPAKGVFLGVWTPKDRDGNSLGKTFNLFAAPYDLGLDENNQGNKLVIKYNDTVKAVGKITGLMGHAGAKYKNDTELYDALRSGAYKGEWFIPTRDIVNGTDVDGNKVQNDNLYAHHDKGAFKGTFTTASGSGYAHWYWSCTEHRDLPSYVYVVDFTDGHDVWGHKDTLSLSARVVRAELRP